jgi:hypothetical protein
LTIFDLIRHLLIIVPTCGGFVFGRWLSAGVGASGWLCGLFFATLAHFTVMIFFGELARWAERKPSGRQVSPELPPHVE